MMVPSVLKRTYDGLALFALLNLVVLGGMAAYLLGTGAVDAEKVRRITAVLRDEDQLPEGSESVAEPAEPAETTPVSNGSDQDLTVDSKLQLEIIRREAERIKEELRQRLALNNSILLRITTERENFRQGREAAAAQDKAEHAERETAGYIKQIAILEGLKPKTAVEHLLALGDPDEAAGILLAMETRKAKKIVEAAKRPDQMEQMKLILRRLRDAEPQRSTELSLEQ